VNKLKMKWTPLDDDSIRLDVCRNGEVLFSDESLRISSKRARFAVGRQIADALGTGHKVIDRKLDALAAQFANRSDDHAADNGDGRTRSADADAATPTDDDRVLIHVTPVDPIVAPMATARSCFRECGTSKVTISP
jgi:hypothetical protein